MMMRKFVVIILVFLGCFQNLKAQYKFEKIVPYSSISLSKDAMFEGSSLNYYFKFFNQSLHQLEVAKDLNKINIKLSIIDVENDILVMQDSFVLHKDISSFSDFILIDDDKLFFVFNNQLIYYDFKNKTYTNTNTNIPDRQSFNKIQYINNQFFLLYSVYPYHPIDGLDQVEIYIYDYKNDQIVHSKIFPLKGISLGNAVQQWVRVINEEIYVVEPFSGKIIKFDLELNETELYHLNIEGLNSEKNKLFVQNTDSTRKYQNEIIWREHLKFLEKYGENYLEKHYKKTKFYKNTYYSKERISARLNKMQTEYTYIEKIYPYNKNELIITIRKPEYSWEFQDLYFVDIQSGDIVDSIIKWRCMPSNEEVITELEDYFPVNLSLNRMDEPFFFNNKVYSKMDNPIELFKQGTKKEIDSIIFNWSKENGKTWSIIEYQLEK